ncbi:MAG: protein-glutamate O-methyltransferase CheR [Myxococcota bacterium]|nr:protein-glutamate O-methyltransferase CheR [Myxococcota bacterium]
MTQTRRASGLTDAQFSRLCRLIQDHFGIEVPERKRPMLEVHLAKLAREMGYLDFASFFAEHLSQKPSEKVVSALVDGASTNHTYFWREPAHFRVLQERVIPELMVQGEREHDLRIWCAAAATGEEAVTLAMLAREAVLGTQWHTGVLATDISSTALGKARGGSWRADNVERLPQRLQQHFLPEQGGARQLSGTIQDLVTWRRLNLLAGPYPFRKPFQVVFCRNVLIYFDEEHTRAVLNSIHEVMVPGGYLFLSHSETIGRNSPPFEYVQPGVYRRRK